MNFLRHHWLKTSIFLSIPFLILIGLFLTIEYQAKWELESLKQKARTNGELVSTEEIGQFLLDKNEDSQSTEEWRKILKTIQLHEIGIRATSESLKMDEQETLAELPTKNIENLLLSIESEIQTAVNLLENHPLSSNFYAKLLIQGESVDIILDESTDQATLAKFFNWKATICMKKGESDEAIKWWKRSFLIEREIRQTPFRVNSGLAHRAVSRHVIEPIRHWVKKGKLSAGQLKEIEQCIDRPTDGLNRTKKILELSRASQSEISFQKLVEYSTQDGSACYFPNTDKLWRFRTLSIPIQKVTNNWHSSLQELKKQSEDITKYNSSFEKIMIPSKRIFDQFNTISGPYSSEMFFETEKRCFLAYLAAVRFTRQNKRTPASLSELVPDYLESLPNDPYSGKPLHYKSKSNSFTLWSVGADGVDDGGDIELSDSGIDHTDIGLTFKIPKE